jgi:hypothetical protein
MPMNTRALVPAMLIAPALLGGAVLIAGPLNPPAGPVAGTHKTLTEVEPRIAINATNTPGDADSLFKITQPGSYYLTGNVSIPAASTGIEIVADDVTVDLNGFALIGQSGAVSGVRSSVSGTGVVVRHGLISGTQTGVALTFSAAARVEDVTVHDVSSTGIAGGIQATIRDCTVRVAGATGISASTNSIVESCNVSAATSNGISVSAQSVITGCTSSGCGGSGFTFSTGSVLSHCVATANTGVGFNGAGVGSACAVTECVARDNLGNGFHLQVDSVVSRCTARANGGHGFTSGLQYSISDCTATFNTLSGIVASGGRSAIRNNLCASNGNNGDGAGIWIQIGGCIVEGNNCILNDRGIDVDAAGNFLARNVCSNNTTNWDVAASNKCLVVLGANSAAIVGNAGGVSPGSTDPNANFTY